MTFSGMIDYLRPYCAMKEVAQKDDREIVSVRMLDPREAHSDDGTLYFTYGIPAVFPTCCLACPVNPEAISTQGAVNLAILSPEQFNVAFIEASRAIGNVPSDNFQETVMETLERVRNVDSLIDLMSCSFGAPLVFLDRKFRILSYSSLVPVTDSIWKDNIERGFCDYEFINAVQSMKSVQSAASSSQAYEVSCKLSPYRKFTSRVYCRDVWMGSLLLIEGENTFRTRHLDMLRILSDALGYAVMTYSPNLLYRTDEYHTFLYNLLIGADVRTQPEVYRHLSFTSSLRLLYCRAMSAQGSFPSEGVLNEQLGRMIPGSYVIVIRDRAAVIGSEDLLSRAETVLRVFPRQCRVRIGVSRAFDHIERLKSAYDEAQEVCQLGQELDPDREIYVFDDYSVYTLLRHLASYEDPIRYLHPALELLSRHDEDSDAKLMETLQAYLKHNCSIKDTSEAMFLHRNSLIYRLGRIREICGVNLSDADTCLHLRMSFMLMRLMQFGYGQH